MRPEFLRLSRSFAALSNHWRLKADDAIRACAATGGMMGIADVPNFVPAVEPATIAIIVDHIDPAVKLVGMDHIGIGIDLGG